MTDEPLWTKRDVATFLNVGVRVVERLRIPRVPLPGRGTRPMVRFDPSEVRAWVEAQRTRKSGRKAS